MKSHWTDQLLQDGQKFVHIYVILGSVSRILQIVFQFIWDMS
jgi:hypothetical protein